MHINEKEAVDFLIVYFVSLWTAVINNVLIGIYKEGSQVFIDSWKKQAKSVRSQ